MRNPAEVRKVRWGECWEGAGEPMAKQEEGLGVSGSHGGLNRRCCPCGPDTHSQDRVWPPHTQREGTGQTKPPWMGRRWQEERTHTRCARYCAWQGPCNSEALGRDSRAAVVTEQRWQ